VSVAYDFHSLSGDRWQLPASDWQLPASDSPSKVLLVKIAEIVYILKCGVAVSDRPQPQDEDLLRTSFDFDLPFVNSKHWIGGLGL